MKVDSISGKIIRNTLFNLFGLSWSMLVSLALTPFILGYIGPERFGIWALSGVITGYFFMLDFGVGTSFIKYISEFRAKNNKEGIDQLINTGIFFYAAFSILLLTAGYLLLGPLAKLLNIPAELLPDATFVFFTALAIFSVINTLSALTSVQAGLQRMDIMNKVNIFVSVINAAGTVMVLYLGYGVRGLLMNNLAIALLTGVINSIIAFNLLPGLRINPKLIRAEMLKLFFSFGYKMQFSRLAQIVCFQTDKLIISRFVNINMVTFYQLGASVVHHTRQLPLLLISALIPAVSELEAKSGKESLRHLFIRGSRYLILVSTPLLFFLVTNAALLMLGWMGSGAFGSSANVVRILAFGYYAATVTGVASAISAGVARTDLDMKFGIFLAVLNVSLSILLVLKFGFFGAAAGTAFSIIAASTYFMVIFCKMLGSSFVEYTVLFLKPAVACILPAAITLLLNYFFWAKAATRVDALFALAINGLVFLGLYPAVILGLKYLDEYDRSLIKAGIPFLKGKVR